MSRYSDDNPLETVLEQIAELANVPIGERGLFFNWVRDTVEDAVKRPRRAAKPGQALLKAADAARALNEAVCSLTKEDREWVRRVSTSHPWLSEEPWLRVAKGAHDLAELEIDELNRSVHLLEVLFKTSISKSPTFGPGMAVLSEKKGRKRGPGAHLHLQNFVRSFLICVSKAGGTLTLDKNKNTKKGTLVEALEMLRPYLPEGLIPKVLPLSLIQIIKTQHLKHQKRSAI